MELFVGLLIIFAGWTIGKTTKGFISCDPFDVFDDEEWVHFHGLPDIEDVQE